MKSKMLLGGIAAFSVFLASAGTVAAMPADIEEAVTSGGYNAYEHVGGSAYYDESDLLSMSGEYVATANAMIRTSPFGEIIGSTTPGETYHVVGECPDCMWYKISGNETGYVYASYLVPGGSSSFTDTPDYHVKSLDMLMTVCHASSVNVRTAPSSSGRIVDVVREGEEVHVTGNVLGTQWYECERDGETVYICDDYLKPEFPQTMVCKVKTTLNIRESASAGSRILGVLRRGDKIKVSADENDWLRFSLPDGTIGYVSDEYMAAIE